MQKPRPPTVATVENLWKRHVSYVYKDEDGRFYTRDDNNSLGVEFDPEEGQLVFITPPKKSRKEIASSATPDLYPSLDEDITVEDPFGKKSHIRIIKIVTRSKRKTQLFIVKAM